MSIKVGNNMEYVRSADKSFAWGVEKAAQIGYKYIEPMVHWGRELLSEAGYFHSVSMLEDPFGNQGVDGSARGQSQWAIRTLPPDAPGNRRGLSQAGDPLGSRSGTDVCNTDEGLMPAWMDEKDRFSSDAIYPEKRRAGRGTTQG